MAWSAGPDRPRRRLLSAGKSRLPEAGQTIAGFHLVEELGRGAFARVFLARSASGRPARRPEVARTGRASPRPGAAPAYAHRPGPLVPDRPGPACTCSACPTSAGSRWPRSSRPPRWPARGPSLIDAFDRLDPEGPPARPSRGGGLGRATFAQAIAWWGARLAEVAEHAHDRGVLHRDSSRRTSWDGRRHADAPRLQPRPESSDRRAEPPPPALGTLVYMPPWQRRWDRRRG